MKLTTELRKAIIAVAAPIMVLMMAVTSARAGVPDAPNPPRLVNDFANLMSQSAAASLEDSLTLFARHTSTQVAVVTISDLEGREIAEYAQEIAEKWGIGQKGKDNGVIILVKPKTSDSQGRAFIGTGYGVEGALPDVTCSRIVREVMIPHFKENDYAGGIEAGAVAVMKAVQGEYEADEEDGATGIGIVAVLVIVGIVVLLIALSDSGNGNNSNNGRRITRSPGNEWLAADLFAAARASRGSGGWSCGSGGFSGGGFGGFGGGSFGGGGGGGSW